MNSSGLRLRGYDRYISRTRTIRLIKIERSSQFFVASLSDWRILFLMHLSTRTPIPCSAHIILCRSISQTTRYFDVMCVFVGRPAGLNCPQRCNCAQICTFDSEIARKFRVFVGSFSCKYMEWASGIRRVTYGTRINLFQRNADRDRVGPGQSTFMSSPRPGSYISEHNSVICNS